MTQKKSNAYARIRTADELDKAIAQASSESKRVGRQLGKDVHHLQEGLKPARLMNTALKQFSPYLTWSGIALGLVRGTKRLVGRKPAPRKTKSLPSR